MNFLYSIYLFSLQDVIGAAETGSGKTLAFGLPVLQRLLEEREKADNVSIDNSDAGAKIAARGFMRALIITPTRELALQVLTNDFFSLFFYLLGILNEIQEFSYLSRLSLETGFLAVLLA